MLTSDFIPITLKRELLKILKLTSQQIKILIDTNEITIETIGKKVLVSNSSLQKFKSKFNRDDYVTKRECISMLREEGCYGEYNHKLKMYDKSFIGYPHTYQKFKSHNKLKVFSIGKSDFVEKKSLVTLINNLKELEEKLYPKRDSYEKVSKPFISKSKNGYKNILQKT